MDTASDNPLRRFTSYWLGLAIFFAFAILCLLVGWMFSDREDESAENAAAAKRMEIFETMEAAQAAALKTAPESVFDKVGKDLLSSRPEAVRDNAQVVPGSPRAVALQDAPDTVVTIDKGDPDAPIDAALMEAGQAQYILCQACHGAEGQGMPGLAPPLAKSNWVEGPVENLIRIQLRGLHGPLTVSGVKYDLPVPMIAQAFQTDEQVAAVLTYVRNSFGNKASAVTPEQVKAFRGEVGKPPLTEADLIPTGDSADATPNDQ